MNFFESLFSFRKLDIEQLPPTTVATVVLAKYGAAGDLLDHLVGFAQTGGASEQGPWFARRLVIFAQDLIMDDELLEAYFRLMIDQGVETPPAHSVPSNLITTLWEDCLHNRIANVQTDHLLALLSDLQLLQELHDSVQERLFARPRNQRREWEEVLQRYGERAEPMVLPSQQMLAENRDRFNFRIPLISASSIFLELLRTHPLEMPHGKRIVFDDGTISTVTLLEGDANFFSVEFTHISLEDESTVAVAITLTTKDNLLVAPFENQRATMKLKRTTVETINGGIVLRLHKRSAVPHSPIVGRIGAAALRSRHKAAGSASTAIDQTIDSAIISGGGPVSVDIAGRAFTLNFRADVERTGWLYSPVPPEVRTELVGTRARVIRGRQIPVLELDCVLIDDCLYLRAPDERLRHSIIEFPLRRE